MGIIYIYIVGRYAYLLSSTYELVGGPISFVNRTGTMIYYVTATCYKLLGLCSH